MISFVFFDLCVHSGVGFYLHIRLFTTRRSVNIRRGTGGTVLDTP